MEFQTVIKTVTLFGLRPEVTKMIPSLISQLRSLAGSKVQWNGNNNIFLSIGTKRIQVTRHNSIRIGYTYSYHVEGDTRIFMYPNRYLSGKELINALNKLKSKELGVKE